LGDEKRKFETNLERAGNGDRETGKTEIARMKKETLRGEESKGIDKYL
jgi:hypothetical protein